MKEVQLFYRVYRNVNFNIKKPKDIDTVKGQEQRAKDETLEYQRSSKFESGGPWPVASRPELEDK